MSTTSQSEVGALQRVLIRHARDAFRSQAVISTEWRELGFATPPDFNRAAAEYDRFLDFLHDAGTRVDRLPDVEISTLDSIYVRDASVVCDCGAILCRMGKPQRDGEPEAHAAAFRALGVPIVGAIQPPGKLEGGDLVWLDRRTVAVGRGYRTNAEGIEQLHTLLGDSVDEVIAVALPHWRGPGDVFHLMSIISPIDVDLAVVYSPLMSVAFRERLLQRGMTLIEVPDEEFDTMGANVLALAPRCGLMLAGNPQTRARLERAGVDVLEYEGREISLKGGGGPTCLTRPLEREAT